MSSSLVQRRALNSSAFGPRVRVSMCQLEGLVAAGKGVERMMGIARGEQAFRASHVLPST